MSSPKPTLDDLRIERSAESEPDSRFRWVVVGVVLLTLAAAAVWWRGHAGAIEVRTAPVRQAFVNGVQAANLAVSRQ